MNYKTYEKRFCCYLLSVFFLISFLLFLSTFFFFKHYTYLQFTGIVSGKNIVLIINDKDKKYFYQNKYLYVNSQKHKFIIQKINNNILKQQNKTYHELFLQFSFSKQKYHENDPITFSLPKTKERNLNLFKYIWKEN